MSMQYDVFICHASEDKKDFVRPLAESLTQQHIDVWYDEFSLSIGDSLTQKIDEGLARSRFGIVVLSPNFFKKPWAKRELNGLTMREMVEKRNLILPVWHQVSVEDVMKFSPPLADKKAGTSDDGISTLVKQLTRKIKPDDSPLIIARDYLAKLNVDSPPISDEWWLDIIEYKELLKYPDINVGFHWIFPLPNENDRGKNRGLNIASAVLQRDWSNEAEEQNISSITHPEIVHKFIRESPGLFDCARTNPALLALYAPQLTIPGFDTGFADLFDELLKPNNKIADIIFSYGSHDTVDDKEPLCGDVIAYRHTKFGNFTPQELGKWYFDAHDGNYYRSPLSVFEGLIWLLSTESYWLPDKHKEVFIEGIRKSISWTRYDTDFSNSFITELMSKRRSQFKLTRTIKSNLNDKVAEVIANLGIKESAEQIVERILAIDLIRGYYDYQDYLRGIRERHKSKNK
jgi:hypothetical protein